MATQSNVLPTDVESGVFEGRPTKLVLCPCGCKRPTALFADDGETCVEQTKELRGEDTGVPPEDLSGVLAYLFGGREALTLGLMVGDPDALIALLLIL